MDGSISHINFDGSDAEYELQPLPDTSPTRSGGDQNASRAELLNAQTRASSPARSARAAEASAVQSPMEAHQFRELQNAVAEVFGYIKAPERQDELTKLVYDRTAKLREMGVTAEAFRHTIAKGRRLDTMGNMAVGFARSVPFGLATVAQNMLPATVGGEGASLWVAAVTGGFGTALADKVGGDILKDATSKVLWYSQPTNIDELEPLILDALPPVRSPHRQGLETGAALQTLTARNLLRMPVAAAVTALTNEGTAQTVDMGLSAIGSPLSGAGTYAIQHHLAQQRHEVGPQYLLGRKDWVSRYKALRDYGVTDAAAGLGRRLVRMPVKAVVDVMDGHAELTRPEGLIPAVGLGAGLTLTGALSGAAAKHASPPYKLLAGLGGTTLGISMTALEWGYLGKNAERLAKKVSEPLNRALERHLPLDETDTPKT